jgi:MFS transporter, ACS family, D-galactonate transporter
VTSIAPGTLPASIQNEEKRGAKTASPRQIPRLRWGIGVLLGVGVLVNYFDRINLSVTAPQLKLEFGLTDGELGWLFSGFFWSYALLQIPTGMILDRFGVTSVNRVSTFFWSFCSAATAFASGFGTIFGARVLLGVARLQAFPQAPRRRATGFHVRNGRLPQPSSMPRQNSPTSSAFRWWRSPWCISAGGGDSASPGQ